MVSTLESVSIAGWIILITGALLVLLPMLAKYLPSAEELEKVPPILLYAYRKDGFTFVTSPILIIISLLSMLWSFLRSGS